jgi:hypothetical protein
MRKRAGMDLVEEWQDPAVQGHVVRSKYSNRTATSIRSNPAAYIRAQARRADYALMWDKS